MRRAFPLVLPLAVLCFAMPAFAAKTKSSAAKSAPAASVALPAGADTLIWRGDHATARAIMDDLAKEYAKEKKGRITLEPFSTISGLDAVAQGTADIAGSARGKYLKRPEDAGINFVPVALDAAVMITYPKNPVTSLTLRQVYDIYYGRITNWSALGGEAKDINLYGIAAPLDGVEFSVRDLVFRNGDQRVAVPRLYLNTTKLEEGIAIDPAGLGLSTLASIHANKGVKALAIEGIGATPATIADGSYPLYITLFLAAKVDSPKQAAIDRFVSFLSTPSAKAILKKHQLIPYADANDLIAKNDQRMAFFDARVGRDAITAAALAAGSTPPAAQSAPRAVLSSRTSIAPTAESTQAARENLARAEAKKQAEAEARKLAAANAKKAAQASAAPAAAAAPKAQSAPAKKVAAAPKKPAAKAKVAKVAPAKPKPVEAPAKAPASFGNVSAGSSGH
jgi:phosphate transport system substrate-binding protein